MCFLFAAKINDKNMFFFVIFCQFAMMLVFVKIFYIERHLLLFVWHIW